MSLLRIDFTTLQDLIKDFDIKLSHLPKRVQQELIETAAEAVLKQVKANARKSTRGQYSLGESDKRTIANAAFIDKKHFNDTEPYVEINFKGTTDKYYEPRYAHPRQTSSEREKGTYHISYKHGITTNGKRRIAEIAFLNEYGVPRNPHQNPKGYLKEAMYEGMAKALDSLLDILQEYIADSLVG